MRPWWIFCDPLNGLARSIEVNPDHVLFVEIGGDRVTINFRTGVSLEVSRTVWDQAHVPTTTPQA